MIITKQIDAAIHKNQNEDLKNKISCSVYQRSEGADLHPNEPVSAPPTTGPIDGPTYF